MGSRAHSSDFHSRIRAEVVSKSFGIHAPYDFRFSDVSASMETSSRAPRKADSMYITLHFYGGSSSFQPPWTWTLRDDAGRPVASGRRHTQQDAVQAGRDYAKLHKLGIVKRIDGGFPGIQIGG